MSAPLICRCLATWLMMLATSMANGALREFVFSASMNELAAHQLSTLSGGVLIGLIIWRFVRRFPPSSKAQAIAIGVFWLVLTVTFEFVFFHYVGGYPWSALLANYDLAAGRLWVLLLAWITLAPCLFLGIGTSGKTKAS